MRAVKIGAGVTFVISEKDFSALASEGHLLIAAGATIVIAPNDDNGFLSKVRDIINPQMILPFEKAKNVDAF